MDQGLLMVDHEGRIRVPITSAFLELLDLPEAIVQGEGRISTI